MEANNHFNFGGQPSVSPSSGMKRSSGAALYTNGSSTGVPQEVKSMNGVATLTGASGPGPQPPPAYALTGHRQTSLGYDYLWGQQQYGGPLGTGPPASMQHKQGPGAALQQHFQGHGEYQLNGGPGGQYWNRGSPSLQQTSSSMPMGYASQVGYGAYHSQPHPSMVPQQHQQQQRYGMVSNGIPYFHQSAAQPPALMMPSVSQSYGHQHPRPLSAPEPEEGAPRTHDCPLNACTSMPAVVHGCTSELADDFAGLEQASETEGFPVPAPPNDYEPQVQRPLVANDGTPVSQWQEVALVAAGQSEASAVNLERGTWQAGAGMAGQTEAQSEKTRNGSPVDSAGITPLGSERPGDPQCAGTGKGVVSSSLPEESSPPVGGFDDALDGTSSDHSPHADDARNHAGSQSDRSADDVSTAPFSKANTLLPSDSMMEEEEEDRQEEEEGQEKEEEEDGQEKEQQEEEEEQEDEDEEGQDAPDSGSGPVLGVAAQAALLEAQSVGGPVRTSPPSGSVPPDTGCPAEEGPQGPQVCQEEEDDDDDAAPPSTTPPPASPSSCQDPFCSHPLPPSPPVASPSKPKRAKKRAPETPRVEDRYDEEEEEGGGATPSGEGPRRRVATEEQVNFPLLHGWRREVRVRRCENRLKGETWYYSPCGRRMKQFPEVIKYLNRHQEGVVTREHFSFSPRMPVGHFYEERESAEWVLLADEEVPSIIMAITGKRGRPPNPDRDGPRPRRTQGGPRRRPGRPPKIKTVDLLSKVDARLLKKLLIQDVLSEGEKEKLNKIKKRMKKKARNKRREDAKRKEIRQEKRRAKLEKAKEPERVLEEVPPRPVLGPRKPGRRRWVKVEQVEQVVKVEQVEKVGQVGAGRPGGARGKAKALAKLRKEAESQAQAALAARRQLERRTQAQRRTEERRRQQLILEELKKPTEDMCLTDQKPLPILPRVPGLALSSSAFAHCLLVVEFLHCYGRVLQLSRDPPSLSVLQGALLGQKESEGRVLDLLVQLVQAALHDPGLPSHYQSVKILGERLGDLELSPGTVSEGLRVFLEARGFEAGVCSSLRTQPFQAHAPEAKAAMLAFLAEELNGSSVVTKEIDSTLENMATYRKNKWIIEGKLRKLKVALGRRTGRLEEEVCVEERRRCSRVEEEQEEEVSILGRSSRRARKEEAKLSESDSPCASSVPELERQIDKLTKRQVFFRKKLLQLSHSLRGVALGQDRYRRRYWALPHMGGVLVEGAEEILDCPGDVFVSEDAVPYLAPVKEEPKPEPLSPPPAPAPPPAPPEVDPLPGTASLMSSPRARGRPRKIKPEVELHLRTAKSRRRRRGSKPGAGDAEGGAGTAPAQAPFLSWLGQSQGDGVKEEAERRGQWFNLLPKTPCDPASLSQPPPATPTGPALSFLQLGQLFLESALSPPLSQPGGGWRRCSSPALSPAVPGASRRRGRPPSKFQQQIEQQYLSQLVIRPIPAEMARGWWWIRDPEELAALLRALHPRGIREKVLHKHLSKQQEYLLELCSQPRSDPMFQQETEDGGALAQEWDGKQRAMEADMGVLRWVEDLEQRVMGAHLQIKGVVWPEPDSAREDLRYHEHQVQPQDDWIVRTKREWSDLLRLPSNPLDLAVLRLARLERRIERRFLKEPLWSLGEVVRLAPLTPPPGGDVPHDVESLESEITFRLRSWRQALDRCRSAAQLSLCLLQLERAIAWDRSVISVANGDSARRAGGRGRKRQAGGQEPASSDEEAPPKRAGGVVTGRRREGPPPPPSPYARFSGDGCSPAKRRRMTTRNQPDLTYCEIILMEMEAHSDAWPFLEPVNPRLVPGYRRIVKNPMDFLTMRERLLQGGYCSSEEFAADAQLVFSNCELFNEDTSEVGVAGHAMKVFFEVRWAEFYQSKDK